MTEKKRVTVNRQSPPVGSPVIAAPDKPKAMLPTSIEVQRIVPQMHATLSDAHEILALELRYYAKRKRQAPDIPLDKDELHAVASAIRSLALLAAEEREAEKRNDPLSGLTDEQLLKLLPQALAALNEGPKS